MEGVGLGKETVTGVICEQALPARPVVCVLTRMRLRQARHLITAYRAHRRLSGLADTRQPPGLLKSTFLVEDHHTCFSLSLWYGLPMFSAEIPEHIEVVNGLFGRLAFDPERGPELWSTTWELTDVSHNQRWDELDLRSLMHRNTPD